ncbi:EscU/YscU/HrcU family type III secretion system export apparatus switch protein [Nocardioides rubriscoriae]|uniref:EscU/YscU/HrcU family type III secretion system export apparatus switch protein n=1 Tax=Nocardioides rubriscoriae TaxID=642762 RepID=UPI0011E03B24|nr:EscU/YscU/HrcU family type III secretion system export apparatus switch protein [Nocardioides rubriscoriae]
MSGGGSGEKTEKPTDKRRKQARKEGQVARTQELGPWLALASLTLAAPLLLGRELDSLAVLMERALRVIEDPTVPRAGQLLRDAGRHVLTVLVVLGAIVMVISVAGTIAQGGFYLATKSVKPSAKKLNLLQGAKRTFGPHALWEGVKMLLKCSVVGLLVWGAVRATAPLIGTLVPMGVVIHVVSDQTLQLVRTVAIAGIVMAALDYAMNRRRTNKQTKMSKEDVKQEHKQSEGDPLVKSAIRARQHAAARNRMMSDIPLADVVLTNPTHVAVALRYEAERGAPVVVARGAGVIAARIREVAAENRVPLVQDIPLARSLYRSTRVGQEIPPELFAAVAHVLAFVISRRNQGVRGGQHRSPRREADLPAVPPAGRRRRVA